MTDFAPGLPVTGVVFKGLNNLTLPFRSHLFDGLDDADLGKYVVSDNDKYVVKSVTGLEPAERTVAIARTASGGKFQGATVGDREVVVLIGLYPDWDAGETPKALRDHLYSMIYTGYDPKVDIQLLSSTWAIAHEFGYITKFEESLFDANPAVQLTFSMLNPTFREYKKRSYLAADLSQTVPNINYSGTAETGFQFAVKFTGTKNGWFIKQAENQSIGMKFDMTFHDGDVLFVSTIPGQKYIHWRKHRGKIKNKLSILTNDSEWIQLHPGGNRFVVPAKTSVWDWKGPFSYTVQYAGV